LMLTMTMTAHRCQPKRECFCFASSHRSALGRHSAEGPDDCGDDDDRDDGDDVIEKGKFNKRVALAAAKRFTTHAPTQPTCNNAPP
jgi:hypothetical protein